MRCGGEVDVATGWDGIVMGLAELFSYLFYLIHSFFNVRAGVGYGIRKHGNSKRRSKIWWGRGIKTLHSYYTLIVYGHISVDTTMDATSHSDF